MKSLKTAVFLLAVFFAGCQIPPAPPEVRRSEIQGQDLWRAGASLFAGQEYDGYIRSQKRAAKSLAKENLKVGWLRDYDDVRREYQAVLKAGDALLAKVDALKSERVSSLEETADALRTKMRLLGDITLSLTERGQGRQNLARAEVMLREADALKDQGRFEEASGRLSAATECCADAEEAIVAYIDRYLDPSQVHVWKKWTEETVAESRAKSIVALVVSKLERRLTVYKNGAVYRTYGIGLGFNGLSNKRHSGDNATPEGRYRIVQKIPSSQYYKALLINYPNDEDRRRFAQLKNKGSIPSWAGIGGDIEIHGGGPDTLTRGCVSMDNDKMDALYDMVSVGTPVTIVGTNELENYVIRAIRKK